MVTLDGMAKDALLGSSMMGNSRFLFHREEIEKLLSDETIYNGYQGQISYIDLKDEAGVSEIASAISQAPGIMFSGARSLIKMCYVMDMIVYDADFKYLPDHRVVCRIKVFHHVYDLRGVS